jgi:hypothetical protein
MLRNAQRSERGWDEFFSFSFCVTLLIGWREQPISLKKMLEHILFSNHDIDILYFIAAEIL